MSARDDCPSGGFPMSAETHELCHVELADRSGRLVPACTCGWYSPDGSHWQFERHLTRVRGASNAECGAYPCGWCD